MGIKALNQKDMEVLNSPLKKKRRIIDVQKFKSSGTGLCASFLRAEIGMPSNPCYCEII